MARRTLNETNCALTQARLVELFDYDPSGGSFVNKTARRGGIGSVAGTFGKRGYVSIMVDGVLYKAHRLAWLYVHGVWPNKQIDHIDGIKSNNRIANLREASNAENKQNMRKARADSSSGILGVFKHRDGKWVAQIGVKGKPHYLGLYATPELASRAYQAAKAQLHEYAPRVAA